MKINQQRFLTIFKLLSKVGLLPSGGLNRLALSKEEHDARELLKNFYNSLEYRTDTAGNFIAKLDLGSEKTLLIGSHLDTVFNGGAFDGALGVVAGLEILSTIKENKIQLPYNLEVIAFTDEEARIGDFFGSKAITDDLSSTELDYFFKNLSNPFICVKREEIYKSIRNFEDIIGYFELHIEQGKVLSLLNKQIGIVTNMMGRASYEIEFFGELGHAGTTPMNLRNDALISASEFIINAREFIINNFPSALVTFGNSFVSPGAYNIIPNHVKLLMEFRSENLSDLLNIKKYISRFNPNCTSWENPVEMNTEFKNLIFKVAEELNLSSHFLPSGGLHDAQILGKKTKSAMIFIPSPNGKSHCPEEFSTDEDMINGINLLLNSILNLI